MRDGIPLRGGCVWKVSLSDAEQEQVPCTVKVFLWAGPCAVTFQKGHISTFQNYSPERKKETNGLAGSRADVKGASDEEGR